MRARARPAPRGAVLLSQESFILAHSPSYVNESNLAPVDVTVTGSGNDGGWRRRDAGRGDGSTCSFVRSFVRSFVGPLSRSHAWPCLLPPHLNSSTALTHSLAHCLAISWSWSGSNNFSPLSLSRATAAAAEHAETKDEEGDEDDMRPRESANSCCASERDRPRAARLSVLPPACGAPLHRHARQATPLATSLRTH